MSELSEAEKRQKLRERRAAKIKNGASRLGKITGDYSESKSETPSPQPVTTTETPTLSSETSHVPYTTSSSDNPSKQSNRISQSLDKDPEIEDITKFEPVNDNESEPTDLSTDAQQFEAMLQKMLSSQQHQHNSAGSSGTGSAGDASEFDIFSQLLSGQGVEGGNPFAGLGSAPTAANNEENEYEVKLSEYNKAVNDQFKAKFTVVKFFIMSLLTFWFFQVKGFYSSSYEIFRIKGVDSGFVKVWLSLEVVFTGIYAARLSKIKDTHYNYNSKILNVLGMVPDMILPLHLKNKIRWFVKYQELINLIIFDLSVVIFFFGVLSFLHRIEI